jgi:cell division protein FtsI (penicillin-binding protein 3)
MLRQVVMTGTGRRAQLNGYSAAGKTGTAWKFNPKTKSVDPSKYVSSFIGMAPADDPEIVIGVVIDEPRSGARDGGGVAAPIFKEIAQQVLQELKVAPDEPVKGETLVAQDIPESPDTGVVEDGADDPKTAPAPTPKRPSEPNKPKASKKPGDKKTADPDKLSARLDQSIRETDILFIRNVET